MPFNANQLLTVRPHVSALVCESLIRQMCAEFGTLQFKPFVSTVCCLPHKSPAILLIFLQLNVFSVLYRDIVRAQYFN